MHWLFWAAILCIVFLVTYNPRTGNLNKFFTQDISVEDNAQRKAQGDSDTGIIRE